VLDFLAGFWVASVCMLLLGVLTWLGTLEQIDEGLVAVKNKYFSRSSFFLVPKINGNLLPVVLPSGYVVGVVFFFNLVLGTIMKVRWRWQTSGVIVAHFGMLFLLLGAFVTERWSQRGNMAISEGETRDVAEHYEDHVLEVTELKDGKPGTVHVIETEHLTDLERGDERLFRMKNLPFDLKVDSYQTNTRPVSAGRMEPRSDEPVVDGFFLETLEPDKEAERNLAGCRVTVMTKDGEPRQELLVFSMDFHPATIRWGERLLTVNMRKALWKMPFEVTLDDFIHEFHPGTRRPKRFESHVRRLEDGREEAVLIKMNEPMRRDGYTFFQASWGPQDAPPGAPLFSVFEVVKNPADKWPEYALYVTTAGLLFHFILKLSLFISSQTKRRVPTN
jgi:hypothetical protein